MNVLRCIIVLNVSCHPSKRNVAFGQDLIKDMHPNITDRKRGKIFAFQIFDRGFFESAQNKGGVRGFFSSLIPLIRQDF